VTVLAFDETVSEMAGLLSLAIHVQTASLLVLTFSTGLMDILIGIRTSLLLL